MRNSRHMTTLLGHLIVVSFDEAARTSTDPEEVSRLALQTVMYLLRHSRTSVATPMPLVSGSLMTGYTCKSTLAG